MPSKIESIRVTCEGGLDTTRNYLKQSSDKPGCATRLVNYEPSVAGGYRRINGHTYYDVDHAEVGEGECQGKVLGIMIYPNDITRVMEVYAARRLIAPNDNEYKIYKHEPGTGWVQVATGLTHLYVDGAFDVDKVRYDVGNDGLQMYLAFADGVNNATLFDGTTWAFIDSSDTGDDIAHAGGDQALDAPTLVSFFNQTLFLSCDQKNLGTGLVVYSAPAEFFNFTVGDGGGQIVTGLFVVDMKPFRDTLYVFDYNRIKKVIIDIDAGFLLRDVTGNMGVVARDCIVEIGGDLIFLGLDGFRPVQGTDKIGDVMLETISKPIQSLLRARTYNLADLNVNSTVIRNKSQFRFFFGDDSTDVAASRGILGGLRTPDQFDGWEFAETLGIRVSCITSRPVGGDEYVLFGEYDGKVYRMEQGGTFNGSSIVATYSTPYLDIGDTQTRKLMQSLTTFLIGEGQDIAVNMAVNYDWGNPAVANPDSYDIIVEGNIPTYDAGFLYDSGGTTVYGGYLFPVARQTAEGSFFSVRLTFTTSNVDVPYSILGFVIQYQVEGER